MFDSAVAVFVAGIGTAFLLATLLVVYHNSEIIAYENHSMALLSWSQAVLNNLSKLDSAGISRVCGACVSNKCFKILLPNNEEVCNPQDVCRILSTINASYELVFYYEDSNIS